MIILYTHIWEGSKNVFNCVDQRREGNGGDQHFPKVSSRARSLWGVDVWYQVTRKAAKKRALGEADFVGLEVLAVFNPTRVMLWS